MSAFIALIRPAYWAAFLFWLTLGLIDTSRSLTVEVLLAYFAYGPLGLGSAYALNFYVDRHIDRINPTVKDLPMWLQPFSTGAVDLVNGMIFTLALLSAGLTIAFFIDKNFFFLSLIAWLIGFAYSVHPIRLKSRPFLDIVALSLASSVVSYLAGRSILGDLSNISLFRLLWMALHVASTGLLTFIVDLGADARANVRTTAVILGLGGSVRLALGLGLFSYVLLAAVIILENPKWPYYMMFGIVYPAVTWSFWKLYRQPTIEGARWILQRLVQGSALMTALMFTIMLIS